MLSSSKNVISSYNYLENCWSTGSLARTTWQDYGVYQKPYATEYSTTGIATNNVINGLTAGATTLYQQETGDDNVTLPITAFIESGDFDIADRIAIEDVIDAYGFYWDSNNLEGYLSLFLDDAIGVTIDSQGDKDKYYIKSDSQIENSQKRMDYFIKNQMQRRHIMANTFFIELTNNYAHLKKYMILLTTNNKSKTEILTPINYVFKLKKVNGFWKIVYREINLDKPLDLALTKKSN
mgnify:CR=1 FL=1